MTLLYDLLATQSAISGADGGGEYSRSVFRRLVAGDGPGRVAGFRHAGFPLDPEIADLVAAHDVEVFPIRARAELQPLLSSGNFSAFMSGLPYLSFDLDYTGLDVYFAVHGLRPLEHREPFYGRHYARSLPEYGKWLAKYLWEAARPDWRRDQFQRLVEVPCRNLNLIVPSWHTRYSMIEKLDLPARATVHDLYCPETAVCTVANPDTGILDRLGVAPGKYLFMVSGHRPLKNAWRGLTALIEVMDKLPEDRWLPVVITGGVPHGLPRQKRPYIIPTGFVSTAELAALYGGARAFVYPTLNEGFGYPPLEAMSQGTPVLCAAQSSVTEIVGDAGIYFNPTSLDEIRIRLRLAVEDDDLLREYAARGRRRFLEVRERQSRDLDTLCGMLRRSAVAR